MSIQQRSCMSRINRTLYQVIVWQRRITSQSLNIAEGSGNATDFIVHEAESNDKRLDATTVTDETGLRLDLVGQSEFWRSPTRQFCTRRELVRGKQHFSRNPPSSLQARTPRVCHATRSRETGEKCWTIHYHMPGVKLCADKLL